MINLGVSRKTNPVTTRQSRASVRVMIPMILGAAMIPVAAVAWATEDWGMGAANRDRARRRI